jgi:hypothetical protein
MASPFDRLRVRIREKILMLSFPSWSRGEA